MALTRLDIAGYRSVRQLHLELGPVTVGVGPNGSGKTNLYRALYLLAAAALQTLWESALEQGIDDAFPGARLEIRAENGRFSLFPHMPGLSRPRAAPELSDGTLRCLCLLAALLSPSPPPFLALNEPEASLHPDLLEPLGRLIVRASKDSQIWVTTHAEALAAFLADKTGTSPVHLEKQQGATVVMRNGTDE